MPNSNNTAVVRTDSAPVQHSTNGPRIVSLAPSLTETLFSLGLGPWVVGRTGFCIHPAAQVARVPKVGGTKDVSIEKIVALRPTHVLVNMDENTLPTVQALQGTGAQVVVTHPCSPTDNLALITQLEAVFATIFVADYAMNTPANCLKRLKNELQGALHAATTLRPAASTQRVLYLIWQEPWMCVARNTYISRMLDLIGWQTWPDVDGGERGAGRYPRVSGTEPWLAQIDRVLLSSEPYRFGPEHCSAAQQLCPQARVQLVDGELLSWWGSRAVPGLAYLQTLRGV